MNGEFRPAGGLVSGARGPAGAGELGVPAVTGAGGPGMSGCVRGST